MKQHLILIWVLVIFGIGSLSAPALKIRSFDPDRHYRIFAFPTTPYANTNFFAVAHDFSGVGWNASNTMQTITLITPLHFVAATHLPPAPGETLRFLNRAGEVKSFEVASLHAITNTAGDPTDLTIGTLDRPVQACDQIQWYPIANLGAESAYIGREIYVYGRPVRMGTSTIQAFQDFGADPITGGGPINPTRVCSFTYVNLTGNGDDCYVEGGDSGGPTFIVEEDQLFVAGIHSAILTTALASDNFDTFVPHYFNQVQDLTRQDGYPATHSGEPFVMCSELTVTNQTVHLSWKTYPGKVYQVETTSDLLQPFVPIATLFTARTSEISFQQNLVNDTRGYYRVKRILGASKAAEAAPPLQPKADRTPRYRTFFMLREKHPTRLP